MNRRLKIAYLIQSTYYPAGMERVLSLKANYLADTNGHDITVVTTDQMGHVPFFAFSPRIRQIDLGVNYRSTNGRNIVVKTLGYALKLIRHRRRLGRLLRHEHFDIVISMFGHEIQFLGRLRDSSLKVAEIHFSKYYRKQEARRGLWGSVDRFFTHSYDQAVRRLDAFVVLTHEDRAFWPSLPNIHVIHNPSPYGSEHLAALDTKRALAVGRLTYQKGFDTLLDAWAIVHTVHPQWRLDIFGDGPDKTALQMQIDRLGLRNVVSINAPSAQIEREYINSSLYVLSSRYEGFVMTLIEAMAHGVPCVAFACKCGPRDIIQNGVDGLLVEQEGSATDLATAMLKSIDTPADERKAMGLRAAQKIQSQLLPEYIMSQWESLFHSLRS